MSIVVAFSTADYQVWCCDGRVMTPQGDSLAVSSDCVQKIVPIPNTRLICGWVGDRFDASTVLRDLDGCLDADPVWILESLRTGLKRVTELSQRHSSASGQPYCPTAFLLGGFDEEKPLLYCVMPDGHCIRRNRIAAIGVGAQDCVSRLSPLLPQITGCSEAYECLNREIERLSSESDLVGGDIYSLAVTRNRECRPHPFETVSCAH